jgi:hypothetical protein
LETLSSDKVLGWLEDLATRRTALPANDWDKPLSELCARAAELLVMQRMVASSAAQALENGYDPKTWTGDRAARHLLLCHGDFAGCEYAQVTGPPLFLQMRNPATWQDGRANSQKGNVNTYNDSGAGVSPQALQSRRLAMTLCLATATAETAAELAFAVGGQR